MGSMWDPVTARLGKALLGDFELLGKLGEGGMAAVFLAHEFGLNRKVALKVMSPALMMGEGMVERFRQEAVTQANLQHAHIVGVHGVRTIEDLHFFVMQYIPGRTLQEALRSELAAGRLLQVAVVQALVFQIGSALDYAHRRGVLHRDVKPGNILLNGDGDAVVTDFCGQPDYIEACGYFWPEKNDGCDTPGLVAGAEALTGLTLSAFVGCYEGGQFTID